MKTNIEEHQKQLRAASGTPEQFAINARRQAKQGLFSAPEAEEAIRKYTSVYHGAPLSDPPHTGAPEPVDLSLFCSYDLARLEMATPWNSQDHTYATDGRIIVRVAARTEWRDPESGEFSPTPKFRKEARKLFAGIAKHPEMTFVALPDTPLQPCLDCNGKGEISDNNGAYSCFECEETGMAYDPAGVQVGLRRIRTRYFALLRGLPGILVASEHGGQYESLPFVFTGGSGLVAPLATR